MQLRVKKMKVERKDEERETREERKRGREGAEIASAVPFMWETEGCPGQPTGRLERFVP